jgi:phage-related tail protein
MGNMEGKEIRFGLSASALFAAVTTAASCGAVNAMHDSFTALGEQAGNVGSDIAGTAGNQYSHGSRIAKRHAPTLNRALNLGVFST